MRLPETTQEPGDLPSGTVRCEQGCIGEPVERRLHAVEGSLPPWPYGDGARAGLHHPADRRRLHQQGVGVDRRCRLRGDRADVAQEGRGEGDRGTRRGIREVVVEQGEPARPRHVRRAVAVPVVVVDVEGVERHRAGADDGTRMVVGSVQDPLRPVGCHPFAPAHHRRVAAGDAGQRVRDRHPVAETDDDGALGVESFDETGGVLVVALRGHHDGDRCLRIGRARGEQRRIERGVGIRSEETDELERVTVVVAERADTTQVRTEQRSVAEHRMDRRPVLIGLGRGDVVARPFDHPRTAEHRRHRTIGEEAQMGVVEEPRRRHLESAEQQLEGDVLMRGVRKAHTQERDRSRPHPSGHRGERPVRRDEVFEYVEREHRRDRVAVESVGHRVERGDERIRVVRVGHRRHETARSEPVDGRRVGIDADVAETTLHERFGVGRIAAPDVDDEAGGGVVDEEFDHVAVGGLPDERDVVDRSERLGGRVRGQVPVHQRPTLARARST